MRHKKFRNRPAKSTLASVDQAVKAAYDRGEITQDVYDDLVRKGLEDMREKDVSTWADAIIVEEPPAPPVREPEPEIMPPSPITVSTEWTIQSPEPDRPDEGVSKEDGLPAPPPVAEDAPVAETVTENATPGAREEPLILDGSAIMHCFGCLRVDVIEYADRTVPAYLRSDAEGLPKPMVMILCGACRKDPHFSASSRTALDEKNATSWSRLRLPPEMFEGSPAMRTVQYLVGGEVSLLTVNGGVQYRDVDRIVQSLEPGDRMASIDVAAFRCGQRENLRLPYLRGGLTTST